MTQYLGQSHDLIRLREATADDAQLLWDKAYKDAEFMQRFRAHDHIKDINALRLRMIKSRQMSFYSNGFKEWIIEHREHGSVGWAILADFCYQSQQAEFLTGVWTLDKGLIGAGAAANMLLWEYGFKELKLHNLYALVYDNNPKPQKILSAMGLKKVSVAHSNTSGISRFTLSSQQYFKHQKLARMTRKVFGRDLTLSKNEHVNSNHQVLQANRYGTRGNHGGKNNLINRQVAAAAMSIPLLANAVEFNVTEPNDDGTGMVTSSLSWAILQANTAEGSDVITLNTDVTLTGVMKRLIDSDVVIQSDGTQRTIDGSNNYRPLFIKSGIVEINDLKIINGRAQGGRTSKGGPGAGLGGGLFIYDGDVTLNQVEMNQNRALGASRYDNSYGPYGGGGMRGDADDNSSNGGGLFSGNYGGYGAYQSNDVRFGRGATIYGSAGFGGGGYGNDVVSPHGGFGGGGGKVFDTNGGNGGFGAGGGGSFQGVAGSPGFGASNAQSAGLGGAVFIRSGALNILNSNFTDNNANGFQGLGGALFVLHTTTNTNGNNQGMPFNLPAVNGCNVSFSNNMAATDAGTEFNNDDYYDSGELIGAGVGFDVLCPGDLIFRNDFETVN